VDERLDPHRALGNGKPGVSNTFTGTLPAGLSRLTKLLDLCVSRPTPLCTPAGSPCRLARGLVVSGRQEALRCWPTRQLSRLVLRPSSVNFLVRSRPLSVRLHPTAWSVLGSASHTNKPWFIQAMGAARTSTAEGSHRCNVRLLKVSDHRDIGKNAFRGVFPAFVTSFTGLKHLYAPAISPSHPASMLASRLIRSLPENYFSGTLPAGITVLTALTVLYAATPPCSALGCSALAVTGIAA
jgi:hypothetical protein